MKTNTRTFLGFVLLLACITFAVEYGLRAIGVTVETELRQTFSGMVLSRQSNSISGVRMAVVAIRDRDFAPPLALSVKYPLPEETLRKVIARIAKAGAHSILVDNSLANSDQFSDEWTALFSDIPGRSGFYREEVRDEDVDPARERTQSNGLRFGLPLYIAPVIIGTHGLVEQFPANDEGSLLNMISAEHELSPPSINTLIDFRSAYASAKDSIPRYSFSDILFDESLDLSAELGERTVFVGRATSIFMKGQAPSNLYSIPAPPWRLYGPELQAQMVAALASDLKLRRLDDTLGILLVAGWIITCGLIMTVSSAWSRIKAFVIILIAGSVALFVAVAVFGVVPMNLSMLLITSCVTALLISVGILHRTLANDQRVRQDLFMD